MLSKISSILLVLFFPVLTLTSFLTTIVGQTSQANDRASEIHAAIALFDQQQAQIRAAAFCRELGCGRAVVVVVEPDVKFGTSVMAKTTRDEDETGCVLHFRQEYVGREDVIAHEVCHCKNDWEAFGRWGYEPRVSWAEAEARDVLADACAEKLMKRRIER